MKKKYVLSSIAGLSAVFLISAGSSDSPDLQHASVQASDWIIVGSPSSSNGAPFSPGDNSLTAGDSSKATGISSVALGFGAVASGHYSLALGYQCQATNYRAMALGYSSVASGSDSIAGINGKAYGAYSMSLGFGTEAYGEKTMAFGIYNDYGGTPVESLGEYGVSPRGDLFVVGNGDDPNTRSNALLLKRSGETTLTNKHWDSSDPTALAIDDPYGDGKALIVEGHTRLKGNVALEGDVELEGKVRISEPQGDISMGIYGNTP